MGNKKITTIVKRITSWALIIVMLITCFGGKVSAAKIPEYEKEEYKNEKEEYERASREAEEEIRKAEKEAGIISDDSIEEDSVKTYEGTGEYEDKTITDKTILKEDTEVGNLYINGVLDLNGFRLTVHGDMEVNSRVFFNEGYLNVKGNVTESKNAYFEMASANDYMLVEGNYNINNYYCSVAQNNCGTLEIRGDVTETVNDSESRRVVFDKGGCVVLSGDKEQIIDMRADTGWEIDTLIIRNTSEEGVVSKHIINAIEIQDENGRFHYEKDGNCGEQLTEDTVIDGDYVLLMGTLDLSGHELTINGNLIHAGGRIVINGGKLTVKGDYKKQYNYEKNGEEIIENSTGILIMDSKEDYVLIEGDYTDLCVRDESGYLKAGTIELKGNIKADESHEHYLLHTSDEHVIRFTGSGQQLIETGKKYNDDNYLFANMEVDQKEGGSVSWDGEITVTGTVMHKTGNISGITGLSTGAVTGSDLYGVIKPESNYKFKNDTDIHGDLYIGRKGDYRDTCYIDSKVRVYGDCYVSMSEIRIDENEGLLTVDGNLIISESKCNISKGEIEVCGDIEKAGSGYLYCEEGAILKLTGSTEQKINVSDYNTKIVNLVVDNPEGVVVAERVNIINATVITGYLTYATGGITGYKLNEDEEYDGDMIIEGGDLELNGHTLHIKGNLTIKNGTLTMKRAKDYLIVDGDISITTVYNYSERLTNGTLEVKGNFNIDYYSYSFVSSGKHTIVFSGTEEQKLTASYPNGVYLNNVTFEEGCDVNIEKPVTVSGLLTQRGNVRGSIKAGDNARLNDNKYKGDIIIAGSVTLNNDTTIDGKLTVQAGKNLNVKECELTVTGAVIVKESYSCIRLRQGILHCGELSLYDSGYISMGDEDDLLIADGNIRIDTTNTAFSNGTIKVSGDVTISGNRNITFAEENTIVFEGTGKQKITMDGRYHCFGKVVIENTSEEGIYVSKSLNYAELDNTAGGKVTFADGGILGYTLQNDETIEGDLKLSGGVLNVNGHKLDITGNLDIEGGRILLGKGSLTVSGNLNNVVPVSYDEGTVSVSGDWDVNGAAEFNDTTFNIGGNIKSSNNKIIDLRAAKAVVFCGSERQIITTDSELTHLGNVNILNEEGIEFTDKGYARFYGELTTNENPVTGVVYLCGTITDEVIRANVNFLKGSKLIHDITVEGNAYIGGVELEGYCLQISRDAYINYGNDITFNDSTGRIEIKGDIKRYNAKPSYSFGEGIEVILSGDKKQTIDTGNGDISMHKLSVMNTSEEGVFSNGIFNVDIVNDPDNKLHFPEEGTIGYRLNNNTVINGDMTLITGNMDLNGYKLTITGNLYQPCGKININGGELHVAGDYIWGKKAENGSYEQGKGTLSMSDGKERICVDGRMVLDYKRAVSSISRGTIECKGDLELYNDDYYAGEFKKEVILNFSGNAPPSTSLHRVVRLVISSREPYALIMNPQEELS